MTNDGKEILRLRGELSAATTFLALTLEVLSCREPSTLVAIRRKIADTPIDTAEGGITPDLQWREGVDRFKICKGLAKGEGDSLLGGPIQRNDPSSV